MITGCHHSKKFKYFNSSRSNYFLAQRIILFPFLYIIHNSAVFHEGTYSTYVNYVQITLERSAGCFIILFWLLLFLITNASFRWPSLPFLIIHIRDIISKNGSLEIRCLSQKSPTILLRKDIRYLAMSPGLLIYRGPCLHIDSLHLYHEASLSIIEVKSQHKFDIRIERSTPSEYHQTFKLSDTSILECSSSNGNAANKEQWSVSTGFTEELLIEVSGNTLRKLRETKSQLHTQGFKSDFGINVEQFYSIPSPSILLSQNGEQNIEKSFPRQDMAFDYFDELFRKESQANENLQDLKIFSFESVATGQRKFLVTDYETFFYKYINADVKHVYEIIRENCPCRAYFDLEYEKSFNLNIDGNHLTAVWINLVIYKIFELFGITLGKENIVVLDSSTNKKYSKHVIIIIPSQVCSKNYNGIRSDINQCNKEDRHNQTTKQKSEILFRNNIVIGSLVDLILQDITETAIPSKVQSWTDVSNPLKASQPLRIDSPITNNDNEKSLMITSKSNQFNHEINTSNSEPLLLTHSKHTKIPKPAYEMLWINKENGKKACFVDLGVYTRNRAFRLWNSSKFGKNVAFSVLSEDKKLYGGLNMNNNVDENDSVQNDHVQNGNKKAKRSQNILQDRRCLQDFILKRSFIVPFDLFSSDMSLNKSKKNDIVENKHTCKKLTDEYTVDIVDIIGTTIIDPTTAPAMSLIPIHDKIPTIAPTMSVIPIPDKITIPGIGTAVNDITTAPAMSVIPIPDKITTPVCNMFDQKSCNTKYEIFLQLPLQKSVQYGHINDRNNNYQDSSSSFKSHSISNHWKNNEILKSNFFREASPFPFVDEFVTRYATQGGVQGILSNWILYVAPGPSYRLRYTVAKNRWCQNIQRSHKSNGIALECDLTFMVITQVCFDPDCKGFRSEPVSLPAICSMIKSSLLESRNNITLHERCVEIHKSIPITENLN